ncbi:MAG: sulfatase, partial [Cyclobacteriaceae bacterium]|nr:sulfatase [Cyclobacteriaceae bacterium]
QEIPEGMAKDGYDLSALFFNDAPLDVLRENVVVRGSGEMYGYRKGDWKIVSDGKRDNPGYKLYDLSSDPQESNDLSTKYPDLKAELENELKAHLEIIL